jgi:hypothetical protein
MNRDEIVEEVRAIREELAARFNFAIRQIMEDAQRRQAASSSRIVAFDKPPGTPSDAAPTDLPSPAEFE